MCGKGRTNCFISLPRKRTEHYSGSSRNKLADGWLPKNTVFQLFLSRFLNTCAYSDINSNCLVPRGDRAGSEWNQREHTLRFAMCFKIGSALGVGVAAECAAVAGHLRPQ